MNGAPGVLLGGYGLWSNGRTGALARGPEV